MSAQKPRRALSAQTERRIERVAFLVLAIYLGVVIISFASNVTRV